MDVNATTALIRSLRAEALKAAGLPGAWLGAALALVIPALVEYLMDRDMQVRSAAGDPDAMAVLPDVGIASVAMGVAGVAVLAASVVAGEYTRDPRNGSSRQVTTTMLVQPRRGAAATAKLPEAGVPAPGGSAGRELGAEATTGAEGATGAEAAAGGGGGAGAAPGRATRAASEAWTSGSSDCRSQSTRPGYVDGFAARTACRSGR